ncbi:MAG: hypothetical protein AAB215_04855, partial [Planctomycetota bacterium]
MKSALAGTANGTFAVTAGADDAKERASDGQMTLDDTILRPGSDATIGLRFANVTIPPGATVTSAKVRMYVVSDDNRYLSVTYKAEAADSSAAFSTTAGDLSSRAKTVASVSDVPAAWTNETWAESPDLTALVQEVVSRPGWASGNALAIFLLENASSSYRTIAAQERSGNTPAELVLSWSIGEPPPPAATEVVLSDHPAGQAPDAFTGKGSESGVPLFRFKLAPNGEAKATR